MAKSCRNLFNIHTRRIIMYDVLIIGAGISGCMIAKMLSEYYLKVIVIEKENDVAKHASGANSAIIHSGHDPKPNTLKARFNLEGSRMYQSICEQLKVAYERCGAFVVACNKEELDILDNLHKQALDRNIPCEIMDIKQIKEKEPNISDNVIKGLYLPTTAIVTPWEVCIAAMEEAILNGVELKLDTKVTDIKHLDNYYQITTNKESYQARIIINCAGVYADDIYSYLDKPPYTINARKGEYFVLDHTNKPLVKHIIYPTPSSLGKGVLVVPTIHHNILLGPNSMQIDDKEGNYTTSEALDYVKKQVNKTVNNIPLQNIIHNYAGLRPTGNTHDFYIQEDDKHPNFIHVACIESPGLASAPAIAKYVVEEIMKDKFEHIKKAIYIHRKKTINPRNLTANEYNSLIRSKKEYGNIICRCEQISKQEIIDAINRPCGARTVDGVKRRCRPGMGRCQGGFCQPNVAKIIAETLKIDISEVLFDKDDSNIVSGYAKGDL